MGRTTDVPQKRTMGAENELRDIAIEEGKVVNDAVCTGESKNDRQTDEQGPNISPDTKETRKTKIVEKDLNDGLPIDRGWAWVVLAGATLYLVLFGAIKKNFGILFVAFQIRFQSTASLTSLLTTTQGLINSFMSLFVMTIGMSHMSHRTSIMIGGGLLLIANLITAFSTDIRVLFLSFGVMEGGAIAMVHPPLTSILAEYFCKRRGLANGLAFSGASLGGLVFAPIMTMMLDTYGYTGTFMIIAGMTFNILITGAVMRPIKSFMRPMRVPPSDKGGHALEFERLCQSDTDLQVKRVSVEDDEESSSVTSELVPKHPNKLVSNLQLDALQAPAYQRSESYHPGNVVIEMEGISPLLPRKRTFSEGARRTRTVSEVSHGLKPFHAIVDSVSRSNVAIYASVDGFCASVVDIHSQIPEDSKESENTSENTCWSAVKSGLVANLKLLFDVGLLRNPVFRVLMLVAALSAPSNVFLLAIMVPHARDIGISSTDAGILMSIAGGCGMCSRLIMAFIVDRKYVRLTTVMSGATLIAGAAGQCVRFLPDFASMIVLAVIIGLCCELYHAMFPVLLVEFLTLAKMKSSVGFSLLCQGCSASFVFPVVGYLRDATGDYYASFHFLGTMSMLAGILYILIPTIHKRNQSRQAKTKLQS